MSEPKNRPYKTYAGTSPYAFISYAHADADRVLPVIGALDADRYRLWYDAGIEAGTNWPEVVASHLLHADAVVFFVSEGFLRSQNCLREAHYAVSERKPMLCVFLEDVALPNDLAMQFSTAQVIRAQALSPERIAGETESLLGPAFLGDGVTGYETVRVKNRSKNVWRVVSLVFAAFFLLSVLLSVGYFANWFPAFGVKTVSADVQTAGETEETVEVTEFKDSVSRDILLRAYEGESLYLCGNTLVSESAAIRYRDGEWYVLDTRIEPGRSKGVPDAILQKTSVRYLALVNEGIESFDALAAMPQLVYLDVSGNPVRDLSFLRSLGALKTLKLIGVTAEDWSVLRELPALEAVYVDYESAKPVLELLGDTAVDIIVK